MVVHGMLRCKGFFPQCGNLAREGHIYTPRGQFWRDFWQTKCTECMENKFLTFYQVLGSLGAHGGPWGAEMQGIFPPMWEYRPRGTYLYTKESVLEGFLANKMHRMHGEHVLDVLSSAGVARGKGCYLGC